MQLNHIKLLRLCFAIILGSVIFLITSCDKDEDNEPDNEQELITTVALNFRSATTLDSVLAKDLDGPGGKPPVIEPIKLKANTMYALRAYFFDESKNPVVNITEEVKLESDKHLICFTSSDATTVITVGDQDFNKNPLGLVQTLKTGAAGTSTLKITLKHEPDKASANPCSTGETDVEQIFPVTITN